MQKFVVTSFEENIHEVVVFIINARSKKQIIDQLIELARPYVDACKVEADILIKYGQYHKLFKAAEKAVRNIGFKTVTYYNKQFPIYYFAHVEDYNIYSLNEFVEKHLIK